MDTVKLIDAKLNSSIVDALCDRPRIISPETQTLLRIAFKHGGYVAGGSALQVIRLMKTDDGFNASNLRTEESLDRLTHYFGYFDVASINKKVNGNTNYANTGTSDIDVWFNDSKSLFEFQSDPDLKTLLAQLEQSEYYMTRRTTTGIATEFVLGRPTIRVQVIASYLMPRHDQLRRFDIYNAMCAFDDKTLTYPEHLFELEKHRMIHVQNWRDQNSWTVSRVVKYLNSHRHGYEKLTPESANIFLDMLLEAIETIKKIPEAPNDDSIVHETTLIVGNTVPTSEPVLKPVFKSFIEECVANKSTRKIFHNMKSLIPSLTNEQILMLGAMNALTDDPYVQMGSGIKILCDRSGMTLPT